MKRRQLCEWAYRLRHGHWCTHKSWGPVIRTDRMTKIRICWGCRRLERL